MKRSALYVGITTEIMFFKYKVNKFIKSNNHLFLGKKSLPLMNTMGYNTPLSCQGKFSTIYKHMLVTIVVFS